MADEYRPHEIEPGWRKRWADDRLYHASMGGDKPKYFFLTMLPYTSGDLHIGHWYAMAPSDVKARYTRMKGYNVMFPIGFDAFGLPAENAAIKRGIHPHEWTMRSVERMRGQLKSMGAMWDWDREMVSCLPEYYRWTQWFFLKFFEHGLAYREAVAVDFCPKCNTTLAREQVWGEDRHCERCSTPVVKRNLTQWQFRITNYAEELLDFSSIEWPERVMTMQRNWIGRSEGVQFTLPVEDSDATIAVFTTRPDTVYGMSFAVLAPEHALVDSVTTPDYRHEVARYREQALRFSEIERLSSERTRDGVFTGSYAINPMNGKQVPIFVADYVLTTYGTGAIMGVPAHDERDFDFATRYHLPIPVVIAPADWDGRPLDSAYTEAGTMVNSGPFDGQSSEQGWQAIADYMEQNGIGGRKVNYRLHDWLISRQRYWGAPIPIVYCDKCGTVPVPEEDLPVLLPEDAEFLPTGESPLKYHEGFRYTTCPKCGGPAERETDTMDTFMCSSWYHMRYTSPGYDQGPIDPVEGNYWLPVDQYTGGIEHATMHLLYTRFFTKACRDIGLLDFSEPMVRLFNQGIILGEDNEKMSKSRGNVVNPDDYVAAMGADAVRLFLMFIGPWEEGGPWSSRGIEGIGRFLNRVWNLIVEPTPAGTPVADPAKAERDLRRTTHKTIRRVTDDIEAFHFNTMTAAMMEYVNYLAKAKQTAVSQTPAWREAMETLVLLLAPSCPHITEELWQRLGNPYSIHTQNWPQWDAEAARDDVITIVVQVNGKVRDKVEVSPDTGEEEVRRLALETPGAIRHLDGKQPLKVVYAPGRLVNIVVR
ncbi:MAG: leucine--tRNA ligase [Anaerolineae bacterium]